MGAVIMPIRGAVEAPPITFADIEASWKAEPDITYTGIARLFDVSVEDVMEVIDLHIARSEKKRG